MDFYGYPSKIPRTIDRLCILDCIEIIVNDLGRYGVPERLAMEMIDKYFMPFKRMTDECKERYSKICFRDTPESSFE
ncbi:MAG: hypothetical protein IKV88_03915 [Clostridia bacterium]|nr:hypothetical protein [Clostridia bacterium]